MNQDFRILLLFPPVWEDETPPLGLPTLTSCLRNAGFAVSQRDLNIEFWSHFYEEKKIEEIFYRAREDKGSESTGSYVSEYSLEQFIDAVKTGRYPKRDFRELCLLYGGFSYNDIFKSELSAKPWDSFLMYHDRLFKNMSFSPSALSSEDLYEISTTDNRDLNPYISYYEEHILKHISDLKPSLVGISIVAINQAVPAFTLASLVKKRLDNVHVTIGGPWCSQLYDVLLNKPIIFDMVDSAIVFEGEKALEQLAIKLRDGGKLENIPNLIYKDDGVMRLSEVRNNQDLNSLPSPVFDGFPLNNYELPGILPLQTSRGCYWRKCTFCSYWTLEPHHKARSTDLVIDDIKELSGNYGADKFLFVDASISPNRLRELSRKILNSGIDIKWECFARFEDSLSGDIIKIISKAGCRVIVWGLESGCAETLEYLHKGISLDSVKRILRESAIAGIHNRVCVMYGLPYETFEQANSSMQFLRNNLDFIHSLSFGYYTPERHTELVEKRSEYAVSLKSSGYDLAIGYDHVPLLTPEQLEEIQSELMEMNEVIMARET